MRYAALILSAGISSRMHEFKPMICLSGGTFIDSIIGSFRKAGVSEIMVVTGYKAQLLEKHLAPMNVLTCENRDYASTRMFDSVLQGIREMPHYYDALFIIPGDVPLVRPATLLEMMRAGGEAVRPLYKGQTGHPVLLSARNAERLSGFTGAGGLRAAIDSLNVPITDVEVGDIGVLLDADEPEDYKALRRQEMETKGMGKLWPDVRIQIAKGDTVLTPETAQYLEMIDHTGSIQNACSCMHMSYTKGWKLINRIEAELGFPVVERSQGGANGGGSALTEKGRRLLGAYQKFRSAVRSDSDKLFADIFPGGQI